MLVLRRTTAFSAYGRPQSVGLCGLSCVRRSTFVSRGRLEARERGCKSRAVVSVGHTSCRFSHQYDRIQCIFEACYKDKLVVRIKSA